MTDSKEVYEVSTEVGTDESRDSVMPDAHRDEGSFVANRRRTRADQIIALKEARRTIATSKGGKEGIPLERFPPETRDVLRVFDSDGDGTIELYELINGAEAYAKAEEDKRYYRRAAIFAIVLCLWVVFLNGGLTQLVVDTNKEMVVVGDILQTKDGDPVRVQNDDLDISSDGKLVKRNSSSTQQRLLEGFDEWARPEPASCVGGRCVRRKLEETEEESETVATRTVYETRKLSSVIPDESLQEVTKVTLGGEGFSLKMDVVTVVRHPDALSRCGSVVHFHTPFGAMILDDEDVHISPKLEAYFGHIDFEGLGALSVHGRRLSEGFNVHGYFNFLSDYDWRCESIPKPKPPAKNYKMVSRYEVLCDESNANKTCSSSIPGLEMKPGVDPLANPADSQKRVFIEKNSWVYDGNIIESWFYPNHPLQIVFKSFNVKSRMQRRFQVFGENAFFCSQKRIPDESGLHLGRPGQEDISETHYIQYLGTKEVEEERESAEDDAGNLRIRHFRMLPKQDAVDAESTIDLQFEYYDVDDETNAPYQMGITGETGDVFSKETFLEFEELEEDEFLQMQELMYDYRCNYVVRNGTWVRDARTFTPLYEDRNRNTSIYVSDLELEMNETATYKIQHGEVPEIGLTPFHENPQSVFFYHEMMQKDHIREVVNASLFGSYWETVFNDPSVAEYFADRLAAQEEDEEVVEGFSWVPGYDGKTEYIKRLDEAEEALNAEGAANASTTVATTTAQASSRILREDRGRRETKRRLNRWESGRKRESRRAAERKLAEANQAERRSLLLDWPPPEPNAEVCRSSEHVASKAEARSAARKASDAHTQGSKLNPQSSGAVFEIEKCGKVDFSDTASANFVLTVTGKMPHPVTDPFIFFDWLVSGEVNADLLGGVQKMNNYDPNVVCEEKGIWCSDHVAAKDYNWICKEEYDRAGWWSINVKRGPKCAITPSNCDYDITYPFPEMSEANKKKECGTDTMIVEGHASIGGFIRVDATKSITVVDTSIVNVGCEFYMYGELGAKAFAAQGEKPTFSVYAAFGAGGSCAACFIVSDTEHCALEAWIEVDALITLSDIGSGEEKLSVSVDICVGCTLDLIVTGASFSACALAETPDLLAGNVKLRLAGDVTVDAFVRYPWCWWESWRKMECGIRTHTWTIATLSFDVVLGRRLLLEGQRRRLSNAGLKQQYERSAMLPFALTRPTLLENPHGKFRRHARVIRRLLEEPEMEGRMLSTGEL